MFKFNKSSGQVSRLLLVLAIIVFVAIIIVYLVVRMAEQPAKPKGPTPPPPVQLPVYEKQLGDIRFVFESAQDRGQVLKAADAVGTNKKDLDISNPGAKFVEVTVGAQEKGTAESVQSAWSLGNIVDSQGNVYQPLQKYAVGPWTPAINQCGQILQPEFDPSPCTQIYEVSAQSTGFKVMVETGKNNSPVVSNIAGDQTFLLDIIVSKNQ